MREHHRNDSFSKTISDEDLADFISSEYSRVMKIIDRLHRKEDKAKGRDKRAIRHKVIIEHLYLRALIGGSSCAVYSNRKRGFLDYDIGMEVAG